MVVTGSGFDFIVLFFLILVLSFKFPKAVLIAGN